MLTLTTQLHKRTYIIHCNSYRTRTVKQGHRLSGKPTATGAPPHCRTCGAPAITSVPRPRGFVLWCLRPWWCRGAPLCAATQSPRSAPSHGHAGLPHAHSCLVQHARCVLPTLRCACGQCRKGTSREPARALAPLLKGAGNVAPHWGHRLTSETRSRTLR